MVYSSRRTKGQFEMRHAGAECLDQLDELLTRLRCLPGLREPRRGVFYRRSKAFLHFHEDPAGVFADIRFGKEWERLPVTTAAERDTLLALVEERTELSSPVGAAAGSSRR
jgi:hypothetical protein